MYQSIDEPEIDVKSDAPSSVKTRWLLWTAFGLCAIAATVYLTSPGQPLQPTLPKDDMSAAKTAYRKAISEPNPALRRARLNDYLLSIENGPHENAVLSQIDIINQYDREDWERLQDALFDQKISKDDKILALDGYEADWGGSLLGARDEDIIRLRSEILGQSETSTLPDRSFAGGASPIPETIPDGELAGGLSPTTTYVPPTRIYKPPTDQPAPIIQRETKPLRVRRNVTPRYPRKAQRRNIGAIVTLSLNIDSDGRVAMTEVVSIQAERYEDDFVKAAERAALRTRFHPKEVNGQPVAVSGVTKRYRFEP